MCAPDAASGLLEGPGRTVAEKHRGGDHGGHEQREAKRSLHGTASLFIDYEQQPLAPVVTGGYSQPRPT